MISVASTSIVNDLGAPCARQKHSRALPCAQRSASRAPGSRAIFSITRNAVESDATNPKSSCWSRTTARSDTHSPPSASITARSLITTPGSCPRRRRLHPASPPESACVSPSLSATPASSALPTCDTSPVPSVVTSTITDRPSRVTLKVNLQNSGFQDSTTQESRTHRTFPRPRSPRGRGLYCTIRVRRDQ